MFYQRVQSRLHCPLPFVSSIWYTTGQIVLCFYPSNIGLLWHSVVSIICTVLQEAWACSFKVLFITFGYTRFFRCTLVERRRFHTAIMVYKILHRLSPTYLQDTFKYTTTVTSHVGRNSHRLFVPRSSDHLWQEQSFLYRYASLEFITRILLHCSHSWTI